MKILLIMDPGIPVPPKDYGGHERLTYIFAEEYTRLGHDVTVLAGPDSHCSGRTVTFGKNDLVRSQKQKINELLFVWKFLWKNRDRFDIIHNFGRLMYLLPVLNRPVRKIMTYGRPIARRGIKIINYLPNQALVFTACSNYCASTGNVAGNWRTVYNAIDFDCYELNKIVDSDAPLMFLGRLDKIKGAHTAISVAKETGHKLIIGGNISHTADNYQYYKSEIEPLIDNEQIIYLGALDDAGKNRMLRQSKALLFPIEWDEPFGLVMIEAMACGTPVVAFNRGSVPEVVNVHTGIIVHDKEEMKVALGELGKIDRETCRSDAKERFNVSEIAKQYLRISL